MSFFHGGHPGLRLGEFVLPPEITGAPSCAQYGGAGVTRTDRVYVTTRVEAARVFAALHPSGRGEVYQVEPRGDVELDPDCNDRGLSYQCESARVVRRIHISSSARARLRRSLERGRR